MKNVQKTNEKWSYVTAEINSNVEFHLFKKISFFTLHKICEYEKVHL